METQAPSPTYRFGEYELDTAAGELRRHASRLKLQPQPFKLLVLLVRRAGRLVTREEIRHELWSEGTFVDFEQAVNFCIKQIRDVLKDQADRPLYVQTVPKRGYRFIAPVDTNNTPHQRQVISGGTTARLHKALWANIAELRLAESRRQRNQRVAAGVLLAALATAFALFLALYFLRGA
jgi:DNA-binding winged helix-turn-helix (wHTH) protein